MRLKDKVSIITGAASGIGKSSAIRFCEEGAKVVIIDLPTSEGEKVALELVHNGYQAIFKPLDVSNSIHYKKMIDEVIEKFGRIDILFNNAAVGMNYTPIEEVTEEFIDQLMATNIKGVFLGIQHVVPHMKKEKSGVILSTGSINAIRPRAGLNLYSAAKGAVLSLSKSMALELAPYGIRVNVINPVATKTPMIDEDFIQSTVGTIPLGRLAEPVDIANSAVFLASEEASMITGADLGVDGGRGL